MFNEGEWIEFVHNIVNSFIENILIFRLNFATNRKGYASIFGVEEFS